MNNQYNNWQGGWQCGCGAQNTGMFCVNCGQQPPGQQNQAPHGSQYGGGQSLYGSQQGGGQHGQYGNHGQQQGGGHSQYGGQPQGSNYGNQGQQGGGYGQYGGQQYSQSYARPDYTSPEDVADIRQNKVVYVLCLLFSILFFLPLVAAPNARLSKFYANQSLTLFLTNLIVVVPIYILAIIFMFAVNYALGLLFYLLGFAASVALLVFLIVAIVNVASDKKKDLPGPLGKIKIIK